MNTLQEAGNAMLLAHEGQRQIAEMILRTVRQFFSRLRPAGQPATTAGAR